jgi:hypothetical protein
MSQNSSSVSVFVRDRRVDVAAGTPLLRGLTALAGVKIAEGNYCWTGECGHCEVAYAMSDGAAERVAMACRVVALDGMRVHSVSRYLEADLRP